MFKSISEYGGIEGIDYVECKICGKRALYLDSRHMKNFHNGTLEEYKEIFPSAKIISEKKKEAQSRPNNKGRLGHKNTEEHNKIISEHQSGETNSFYGKTHTDELKKRQALNMKQRMDDPDYIEKISKSALTFKDYVFPSGKVVRVQGYEDRTLDYLLKNDIKEDDMIVHGSEMPKIEYEFEGEILKYFPDLFIKSLNKIIETKSNWTYKVQKQRNEAKRQACIANGYDFEFFIWE